MLGQIREHVLFVVEQGYRLRLAASWAAYHQLVALNVDGEAHRVGGLKEA